MKESIKIGYVGLGCRGRNVLKNCFSQMADVEIAYLCDLSEERLEKGQQYLLDRGKAPAVLTREYEDILKDPTVDAVMLMTGWDGRPQMAKEAMLAGKYTGIEVGCAIRLEECFDLIETYETTKVPLMMLENCCYGRREMMALNMKELGLFGEIVHCDGAYGHYINDEDTFKNIGKEDPPHYRFPHYLTRNCEHYPTHALGPISKVLNLNRGNRMLKLASFATKSVGLKAYAVERFGPDSEYAKLDYKHGDIINTMITCEGGETILLTLDTTLPRAYYSRNFTVRGTKGLYSEERKVGYLKGMAEPVENNEKEFFEKYDHPLHREYEELGTRGGHGGMDWLVCRAFVESVKNGTNTPIDAYDTVLWMCIAPLSEKSIQNGNIPVDVPDFTGGKWKSREPIVEGKYCLDKVCVDPDTRIFSDIE
ncbi:MAG: Gfo/Idh/MocA family oxidoreductase [Clostridia bacterium]|nr:Gfo/Idh/MocA family oxidoreductase [Clostridia bacterium]